ncbi:thioesterase family protein [Nocardia abscessus]|uniref:acyl-CoA thioesterase n=1 Tax=Nocardia abscessus TaxID=120957 RepID=UPI0018950428|nr:thioesterase family protein [Nocardia abscessus]MBF6338688.1 thioesterase family protein [Nocardia abscessus]
MKQLTTGTLAAEFALTATEPGGWAARVDRSWRGWTGPHGGVIAALLIEVARAAATEPLPVRAVDLRFSGRPTEGVLAFDATEHVVGRSTVALEVRAEQDGSPIASASVTLGRTAQTGVEAYAGTPAPRVPDPRSCAPFALPPEIVPAAAHFDIRPAAGPLPLTGADERMMCAWIGLVPEVPADAAVLAILADALPPAVFPTLRAPVAIPTVALSMHLHAEPTGGLPVLVRTVNASTGGGWSVDDTSIWDRSGLLLASARQTRRVLG